MTDPTQTPPPLDLAELTVIAKAATDGPWEAFTFPGEKGTAPYAFVEVGQHEVRLPWLDGSYLTAAHIAAFDPPTVLALIARAEAAEAKIAAVRELHPESIAYPLLPDGTPDLNAAPMGRVCLTCSDESIEGNLDDGEWTVEDGGNVFYPCPTIAALDGTA